MYHSESFLPQALRYLCSNGYQIGCAIAGSADGSVGEAIEWCRYHPYEEGIDPELEGVMTTLVDQERPLESSVRRLHAKKWKDCLQAAEDDLPKSIYDMLPPCEIPWVTKVTTANRPDEEIGVEEIDGGEIDGGETDDGETYDGEIDGGEIDGEETYDGETDVGETYDGETYHEEIDGEETYDGETYDGEIDGGETYDGETYDGETYDGETYDGETYVGEIDGGEIDGEETYGEDIDEG
ncbi:hypothetical protein AA0116_g12868 [Alternaria tenuissima]|nr:hypothetical protein AA0116_g12868 [Alternaria tenuissima]